MGSRVSWRLAPCECCRAERCRSPIACSTRCRPCVARPSACADVSPSLCHVRGVARPVRSLSGPPDSVRAWSPAGRLDARAAAGRRQPVRLVRRTASALLRQRRRVPPRQASAASNTRSCVGAQPLAVASACACEPELQPPRRRVLLRRAARSRRVCEWPPTAQRQLFDGGFQAR